MHCTRSYRHSPLRHGPRRSRHLSLSPFHPLSKSRSIATVLPTERRNGQHGFDSPQFLTPSPAERSEQGTSRTEMVKDAKPFSAFLTDSFGRRHTYLRISLTERCNLRCTYCMPAEGVPLSPDSTQLTTPEILLLSSLFVEEGVNKIRLTGGEPTVRRDILTLMQELGQLRKKGLKELCITSNGIALRSKLEKMVEAGLSGVNISLDSLEPGLYQIMTRRPGFEKVLASIERILDMNRLGACIKLKVNVVVMRGVNDSEILRFVELGRRKDLEVRFIEYMPFDGNRWRKQKMVSYQEMLDLIRIAHPDLYRVQDAKSETSKTWQVPGYAGRLGFITSMTDNFCGGCNRLRITSDGNLKVCLFGNAEVSLRDLLRRDNDGQPNDKDLQHAICSDNANGWLRTRESKEEILEVIGKAVGRKKAKHAGMGALENLKNRPMILIDDIAEVSRHKDSESSPYEPPIPYIPLSRQVAPTGLHRIRCSARSLPMFCDSHSSRVRLFSTIALRSPNASNRATSSNMQYTNAGSISSTRTPSLTHLTSDSEIHIVPITSKRTTTRSATAIAEVSFSSSRPLPLIRAGTLRKGDVLAVARVAGIMAAKRTSDIVPLCHSGIAIEGVRCWVEVVPGEACETGANAAEWNWDHDDDDGDEDISELGSGSEAVHLGHTMKASAEEVMLDPLKAFLQAPLGPHGGVRLAATVLCEGKTGVEMEALCAVVGSALSVIDMIKSVDKGCVLGGVKIVKKEGGTSGVFRAEGW